METACLLLTEDDDLIREALEVDLADAGFKVTAANGGAEALAELNAEGAAFAGIITDIRLGEGLDGWDVARRAREAFPGIPVVYVSGDSGYEWTSKGVPNSVVIAKPFASAQMITAISTLINEASSNRAGLGTDG